MRIRELFEAQNWERFKGSITSRVWFNTRTGQAITTNDDGNHSVGVTNNKELFGLSDDVLNQHGLKPGESAYDYDGRALFPAMQNGWVRIFVDPKKPDLNSNAEGVSLSVLRRAFVWYCEQVGTPMHFTLVVRHGAGDRDGTRHVLADADQMEFFIRNGALPRDRMGGQEQPAQAKQANVTPHAFRKV